MRAKEKKALEIENVSNLLKHYNVVGIADLTNLPSAQLQAIRNKLRNEILIKITKKSILSIAMDRNEKLKEFKDYLQNTIPALILTNNDPFKLFKIIKENKSNVAAKPGQLSPVDITIPAGPTNFPPGPIIGELGAVGLTTTVEGGKIAIKKDKLIVKQGEIIKPEIASVLSKLGIEPVEINLNIVAFYKDGTIYQKDVLDINEQEFLDNLRLAYMQAINLALEVDYIDKENAEMFVSKAYRDSLALATGLKLEVNKEIISTQKEHKEIKEEEIKEEHKHHKEVKKDLSNVVGYNKDTEKVAQDLLKELQDKKIAESSKPKQKSMWD